MHGIWNRLKQDRLGQVRSAVITLSLIMFYFVVLGCAGLCQLTSQSKAFVKFPTFYETLSFITAFRTARRLNPINVSSYSLNRHFMIILPSTPRSSKLSSFPQVCPPKSCMHFSFPAVCHMLPSCNYARFYYPKNITVRNTDHEASIFKVPFSSCHLFPLGTKQFHIHMKQQAILKFWTEWQQALPMFILPLMSL